MSVTKTYEITSFKALPEEGGSNKGRFEAIVSVFGNVDLVGDRVVKGAFRKSLEKWKSSGDPIPIVWSHSWGDPFAHIGAADPALAEETDQGLKLVGTLDVHKPFASQVYDLLKDRRVREWSFAYDVEDEQQGEDKANELRTLDIIEAGPTLKGANPATQTLGVKAALEHAAKREKPERKNVYTPLAGSYEQRQQALHRALHEKYPHEWAEICATYDTYVIAAIGYDEKYVRIPYTGDSELGDPVEVTITATVGEKSAGTAPASKAEGKPWHIEEQDGKFCVIKDDDGSTAGCHDTREEAEEQLRALYASETSDEPDGGKDQTVSDPVPPADEIKAGLDEINSKIDGLLADII